MNLPKAADAILSLIWRLPTPHSSHALNHQSVTLPPHLIFQFSLPYFLFYFLHFGANTGSVNTTTRTSITTVLKDLTKIWKNTWIFFEKNDMKNIYVKNLISLVYGIP